MSRKPGKRRAENNHHEKERIAAIGASNAVAIPRGAQVLDAHGKFLVPGLVDMHVHLTAAGEPDGSRKFVLPLLLAMALPAFATWAVISNPLFRSATKSRKVSVLDRASWRGPLS